MSKTVPVVLISSNAWACAAGVTLQSMFEHYQGKYPLKVYIFSSDMSEENTQKFLSYNSSEIDVEIVMVDDSIFEKFRAEGYYVPPLSFLKAQLQELLPQYDKIIFLDIDLIIKKDISPLMDIDVDGYYMAGVADLPAMVAYQWHKRLNRMRYLNSGVLVLNAKKLRDEGCFEKCMRVKLAHPEYMCNEQDVFNDVFNDEIKYLPITWNLLTYNLAFDPRTKCTMNQINTFYGTEYKSIQELENDAAIIHLTNVYKPWLYEDCYMSDEWLSIYRRSKLGDCPLTLKKKPLEIGSNSSITHVITRKGPFVKDWTEGKTTLRFFNISLIEKIKEGWRTRFRIFGIPVIKREWVEFEEKTYLFGICFSKHPYWPAIKQRADDLIGRLGYYVVDIVAPTNHSVEPYAAWSAQISKLKELNPQRRE